MNTAMTPQAPKGMYGYADTHRAPHGIHGAMEQWSTALGAWLMAHGLELCSIGHLSYDLVSCFLGVGAVLILCFFLVSFTCLAIWRKVVFRCRS